MKALILFIFLQIFALQGFAQFIAGNQGEGVLMNGRIYLRDLYMKGQLEDVYFGTVPNQKIVQRMAGFDRLEISERHKQLLIQKLSDIEEVSPCLGVILADLFYLYSWRWTNEEFRLAPDSAEISWVPPELRRVVAKRYRSEILLQKNNWDLMPESHQVALLIHEMLFSVVWPEKKPDLKDVFHQDVTVVWSLVSIFFSIPTVYTPSDVEVLTRELDIREDIACNDISRFTVRSVRKSQGLPWSVDLRSDSSLEKTLRKFCSDELKESREVDVETVVVTSSYTFQENPYKSFDGIKGETGFGRQTSVKVCKADPQSKSILSTFNQVDVCIAHLKQYIFNSGNPKEIRPGPRCGPN